MAYFQDMPFSAYEENVVYAMMTEYPEVCAENKWWSGVYIKVRR